MNGTGSRTAARLAIGAAVLALVGPEKSVVDVLAKT